MQIHELNNYSGSLGDAFLVADNGSDTGKMKTTDLTDPLNARIDNIISSPAPSAAEIVDARLGADGVAYSSLGKAIRGQVSDLRDDLSELIERYRLVAPENGAYSLMLHVAVGDVFKVTNVSDATVEFRFVDENNNILQAKSIFANQTIEITSVVDAHHIRAYFSVKGYVLIEKYNIKYDVLKLQEQNEEFSEELNKKLNANALSYGYAADINKVTMWEQGHFTDNGGIGDPASYFYTKRIRTGYIPKCDKIACRDMFLLNVLKYTKAGEFVSVSDSVTEYEEFDFENFQYRLQAKKANTTLNIVPYELMPFFVMLVNKVESNYQRKFNATSLPISGYYTCDITGISFNLSTTTEEYYQALDSLINANNSDGYVSKNNLGVSSDGSQNLYEYVFKPKVTTFEPKRKLPKIIIFSAQHGFEKSSVFGMYAFVKDLLLNWDTSPALDYLRNHVEIRWIPIVNPYGFDNNKYWNANGVNLNRNYDCEGFPAYPDAEPFTSQYGGASPFDQPETRIVRDFVLANKTALIGIDFHTNGDSSITLWKNVNWHSYPRTNDAFFNTIHDACEYHLAEITSRFIKKYNLNTNEMLGYQDGGWGVADFPSADVWITQNNVLGMTFEGFNGFVGRQAFTDEVYQANAELICNWFMTVINHFIAY